MRYISQGLPPPSSPLPSSHGWCCSFLQTIFFDFFEYSRPGACFVVVWGRCLICYVRALRFSFAHARTVTFLHVPCRLVAPRSADKKTNFAGQVRVKEVSQVAVVGLFDIVNHYIFA